MAKKYKNRTALKPTTGTHKFGKSLTIKGESYSIMDMFRRQTAGVPLPVIRPTLDLPPINQITEESFDLPDAEKFALLDIVDQQVLQNNLEQLKAHYNSEIDRIKKEYNDSIKPETPPVDPTPPPADPPA